MADAVSSGKGQSAWHRPPTKEIETATGEPGRHRGEIGSERPVGKRPEMLRRKRRVQPNMDVSMHAFDAGARRSWLRSHNPRPAPVEREGANAPKIAALGPWIAYPHKPARDLDAPIVRRFLFVDIAIDKGPKWQRAAAADAGREPMPGVEARPVARLEGRPIPKQRYVAPALKSRRRRQG